MRKAPKSPAPPRWATHLMRWLVVPHRLDELEGDLDELFQQRVEQLGLRRARWRYVRDVVSLLRPSLMKREPNAYPKPNHTTMIRNYLTVAWRHLLRQKVYAFVNMAGLALGLACCTAIGLYVLDEFQYDRFHTNYDRIYRLAVRQKQPTGVFNVAVTPGPLAPTLTNDLPEVAATTRLIRWGGTLSQNRQTVEAEHMLITDPSFFSLFSFPLVAGNPQRALTGPNDVVISETMAARLFGQDWARRNVIGKPLMFNKDQPFTLAGVARNPPVQSSIQFDVLLPYKWLEKTDSWSQKWNSNNYHTYILLKPSQAAAPVDMDAFAAKLGGQLKRYQPETEDVLYAQPLRDVYLRSTFDFDTDWGIRGNYLYVRIFLAVGLIVLLTAVINFINLATARASQRAREVGIRKAAGASRRELIGQFLGESLLMSSLAVVVSLLLLQTLLPLFNTLSGKVLRIPTDQPLFWLILAGLTVTLGVLTGLYPAFFLSSFRAAQVLKATNASLGLSVRSGRSFRQSLVVGQFTFAIVLAISSLVIYRQLAFVQQQQLGFDQSRLLYVRLKGNLRANALPFKQALQQLPGVAAASTTTGSLVDMINSSGIDWEGQRPGDQFQITNMNIDADFMKTTGMTLAAGRNVSTRFASDTAGKMGAYMLNATAAKRMGWTPAQAIGKRVTFWGSAGVVVGVVNDFHFRPLRVAIEPFIFRFRPQEFYFNLLVKTHPNATARVLSDLAILYKKYDADSPVSYGFVDQELDAQYRTEQRTGQIVLCFSLLSIFVSCLGLFGLVTFTAQQRTKEIGVRKVLGASIASIVALLSTDFLRLVLIAIGIASPLAWYAMNRWLSDFAYRISVEWWVFIVAGLGALAITTLTISFQSIKAALMNPVKSLRSE